MIGTLLQLVRHEVEVALRTRRVLLIATLYVGAAVLGGLGISAAAAKAEQTIIEAASEELQVSEEELRQTLSEQGEEQLMEALEQFGVDPGVIATPLRSSVVAPVFFWCSLAFLPFLVILSTFDTLSSDLRGRTLCYTTLRAPRWATVVAKGAAWWVIVSVLTTACALAVFFGGSRMMASLQTGAAIRSAVWISVVLVPFSAAWVAIALWCSATTARPMTALVRAVLVAIGLRLLALPNAMVGPMIPEDSPAALLRYLRHLSPRYYNRGLWHAPDGEFVLSVLALAAFAAVFVALAIRTVRRRDL